MALTKITNALVSVNAIQGTLIADNAITAVHIATNAVSSTLIADNAITAVHIAQNVITVTQLADDAVEADKIADGVITTNHLNSAMISSQSAVTANTSDYVLIGDASDSNALKKALVSDFGNTTEEIQDIAGAMFTSNTETGITATYEDGDGTIDLVVGTLNQNTTGTAAGLTGSPNITVGTIGSGVITCDGLITGNNEDVSIGGILKGSDSTFQILTSTSDGSDSSRIRICGGGSTGSSRGAQLELQGNEHTFVGEAQLASGDVSGAFVGLSAPHSTGYITLGTAGSERMRILADGNVGIGDTSPGYKLSIAGGYQIAGKCALTSAAYWVGAPTYGFRFNSNNDAYNNVIMYDDGHTYFRGAVGMGTATIDSNVKLQIEDATYPVIAIDRSSISSDGNHIGYINFQNNGDVYGRIGCWVEDISETDGVLRFGTQAGTSMTDKMVITSVGYVGIGIETPTYPLHVYGANYSVKIESSTGYSNIGSNNSSYFHHDGNRTFYWANRCEASGGFHTYSDENLKKEMTTITGALASVVTMNGITFKWKDPASRGGGDTGKQFGVTAQNMLTVDAELPSLNVDPLAEAGNEETDDKFYTMDYSRLTPYLIEAIKELKTELDAAKARIAALE